MRRRGSSRYDRHRREEELEALLKVWPSFQWHSKKEQRSQRKKARGRSLLMVMLLLAVLSVVALIFGAAFGQRGAQEPVTVVVREGDSLSSVAGKLEEAGVVRSSVLFKLQVGSEAPQIKPGEYRLTPGESGDEILATLSSEEEDVSTFAVTVPEGLTLHQTAGAVAQGTGIPAPEFEAAARKTGYSYAFLEDPDIKSTEGFLFPKRYEFERGTEAGQIVDRMLEQYLFETQGLDFAAARERLDLTEYELVIVASLIEKESANPAERPVIASVIYNRLRAGMPLQIDATIQYAIGEPKERLSLEDLKVRSPYNTYENEGLPPGPIASPSRESLQAALEPAKTNHLYYVLEAGGKEHFFTNDYDEFLAAKEEAGH